MTIQQGQCTIIGGICSCGPKLHRSEDLLVLPTNWLQQSQKFYSVGKPIDLYFSGLVPESRVFHSTIMPNFSTDWFHDPLTSSGAIISSGKFDKLPWPSAIEPVFVNLYLVTNWKYYYQIQTMCNVTPLTQPPDTQQPPQKKNQKKSHYRYHLINTRNPYHLIIPINKPTICPRLTQQQKNYTSLHY